MNIHEHQAKQILKKYGVAVPEGVSSHSVEELLEKAKSLKTEKFVLKAQIHAGGRGKAGGVKIVNTIEELNATMRALFHALPTKAGSSKYNQSSPAVFGISLKKIGSGDARIEFANHSQAFFKSLESIRMTSKPVIPWGWAVFSILLMIYGVRLAPQNLNIYPMAISGLIFLVWLLHRKEQLIIDVTSGDRHRILGRTENLIRLNKYLEMMPDGNTLSETRAILNVESSIEPSLNDEFVSRMNNEMDLAKALATHAGIGGFRDINNENLNNHTSKQDEFSFDPSMFDSPIPTISSQELSNQMPETGIFGNAHRERANVALANTNQEFRNASNAFDAPIIEEQSTISEGGIFGDLFGSIEQNETPELVHSYARPTIQEDLESAQRTYAEVTAINHEERHLPAPTRQLSSMELIRQAQDQFGPPISGQLPPPTTSAVRDECQSTGLVADAEIKEIVEAEIINDEAKTDIPNELKDYPSLSRMLRRPDHQSRLVIKEPVRSRSSTVINLLRSFNPQRASRRAMGLLRLRSDQDHQAQRSSSAIESMIQSTGRRSRGEGYAAAMESISTTISKQQSNINQIELKLEDLNPTKNSEDDSQYPGMRRLG